MELPGNFNGHLDIINYFIKKYNYKSYLEIGVDNGSNFNNIEIDYKESCDIDNSKWMYDYNITYLMSSDEMFDKMQKDKKYDIIFIDGYHNEDQVDRDIINSLKHLNKGGLILCHDVIPYYINASFDYPVNIYDGWQGSVYKSITKLQEQNIEFYTIYVPTFLWGNGYEDLTIIKYKDNPYQLQYPTYKSKINYFHIFNDGTEGSDRLTKQGKYIMHYVDDYNNIDNYLYG